MNKLDWSGKCLATGEILTGSLIQFQDGTTTIMYHEVDPNDKIGNGMTSPVDPDSLVPVGLYKAMEKYYQEAKESPAQFKELSAKERSVEECAKSTIDYLLKCL